MNWKTEKQQDQTPARPDSRGFPCPPLAAPQPPPSPAAPGPGASQIAPARRSHTGSLPVSSYRNGVGGQVPEAEASVTSPGRGSALCGAGYRGASEALRAAPGWGPGRGRRRPRESLGLSTPGGADVTTSNGLPTPLRMRGGQGRVCASVCLLGRRTGRPHLLV